MHNLGATLTRKVGPLPAYAWVLVLVGGIFAARYLRAQRAASATDTSTTDTTDTGAYDPGIYDGSLDGNSGDTGLLSDEISGLQDDVSNLYDLYGSGDPAFAAGSGTVASGDVGASSAAAPVSAAVIAPVDTAPVATAPLKSTSTDTAPLVSGSYTPNTGVYVTPEGVSVAPVTDYSTDPSQPLLGPSIFAFKGSDTYSAPSPAIAPDAPLALPGKSLTQTAV
jgi:hypothetical protein